MKIKTKKESRREQIIKAAEEVFSQKDFQNSTISDVAKQAGVSDATIYEYFTSKEELLFSIPGENISESKNILDSHLEYTKGTMNKLRCIIYHLLKYYQDNSDFASISLMILRTNRKFGETRIYENLKDYYRTITQIIEDGIKEGIFKQDTNPFFIRSVILGTIEFIVIRWLMQGCPDNKIRPIDNVDMLFDLLMGGIRNENNSKKMNYRIIIEQEDELINERTAK